MECNQDNMKERIIGIIGETIGCEEKLSPSQRIKELNIDSLDIYEIIMKIEEICEIEIDDEPLIEFETINDIIQFYESKARS